MTTRSWKSHAMVVVVAGATAIAGALPASAAPVLTNTAALKQALPGDVQDVRWWGGGAFFGGLLAGGLIGSAIARPYYYGYPGYYGYGYGYSPYAYGYSYPYYSYSYGYPYGGYSGGYYGGWRGYGGLGYGGLGYRGLGYGGLGYGWRGHAWRGRVSHYGYARRR